MVGLIIQARMGSSRLLGKTMKEMCRKPLLYYSVQRSLQAKYVDKVIVATSNKVQDNSIVCWCEDNNFNCYRGSEQDVLDRYYQCAKENNFDRIVRITADNPFIDPEIVDLLILTLINLNVDYVTMRNKTNTWPYGLDVEVFNMSTLTNVWKRAESQQHREHVTMYIKDNIMDFKVKEIYIDDDLSDVRLTVDFKEDFIRASKLMEYLLSIYGLQFSWFNVVDIYKRLNDNYENSHQ